jgi:hypothetical protein
VEGTSLGDAPRDRTTVRRVLPIDRDQPENHRRAPGETHRPVSPRTPDPEGQAIPVRVIEYEIPDREGNGTRELICLITSILDPSDATAIELATAYHERWESETSFGEKKTYLRGSGRVLRSKSPEMVRQEIWALLLTHYAIRKLMCKAADEAGLDPGRLSFIRSLRVIRRQVTDQADFPPQRLFLSLLVAFVASNYHGV